MIFSLPVTSGVHITTRNMKKQTTKENNNESSNLIKHAECKLILLDCFIEQTPLSCERKRSNIKTKNSRKSFIKIETWSKNEANGVQTKKMHSA